MLKTVKNQVELYSKQGFKVCLQKTPLWCVLYTNVPTKCQLSTTYKIHEPRQDFKTHGQYDKVKSISDHDAAHLQPPTNVCTRYHLPTPYGFRDIGRKKLYRSRSLWQGQRSNQGLTMSLHTYNPQPMSLSSINFLHLIVSEI